MRLDCEPWFPQLTDPQSRQHYRELERLICWYFPMAEARRALWMAYHRSWLDPTHVPTDTMPGYGLYGLELEAVPFAACNPELANNPIRNVAGALKLWENGGWAAVNGGVEPTWPDGM